MAKAVNTKSGYEYIRATVSEGRLSMRYRVVGLHVDGRDGYDEDVSKWTDDDIRKIVCQMLDIDLTFKEEVEVVWD